MLIHVILVNVEQGVMGVGNVVCDIPRGKWCGGGLG